MPRGHRCEAEDAHPIYPPVTVTPPLSEELWAVTVTAGSAHASPAKWHVLGPAHSGTAAHTLRIVDSGTAAHTPFVVAVAA